MASNWCKVMNLEIFSVHRSGSPQNKTNPSKTRKKKRGKVVQNSKCQSKSILSPSDCKLRGKNVKNYSKLKNVTQNYKSGEGGMLERKPCTRHNEKVRKTLKFSATTTVEDDASTKLK